MNIWQRVKQYLSGGEEKRVVEEKIDPTNDPMQIFLQPDHLERFVRNYGFQRFPDHRDDVYGTDVLREPDGNGSFVALPEHVNMYQRGVEQDALVFRMSGPMYIRVKGEFLFFVKDKLFGNKSRFVQGKRLGG